MPRNFFPAKLRTWLRALRQYRPTLWESALVECRVCTFRHAASAPWPPGVNGGECPNCGAMACDVVETS